jgi:TonB-linked SusC/RagA family outer membrane protein
MKALFTLFLILQLGPFVSFAQSNEKIIISGHVLDASNQQALIGVNIQVIGTQIGAITDINGAFSLEINKGNVLKFSFLGFTAQDITIQDATPLTIKLETETQSLQDMVVVGYKREFRSDVASAISSVKAKDIAKLPVLGIDQALQGQVAGVQVTQATGAPGDDISVRIRGVNTLGNNNPLFIIDGVPTTGSINMFSTNDIESIEVLKDGAAAAIYGARAANGVVLITTKKGKSGKPSFSFDMYQGIQQATHLPDLLDSKDYLMIRNEAITNANSLRDPRRQLPLYDTKILDTLPNNKWLNKVFSPAHMSRYYLSATGGGPHGSYYLMGEYVDQQGIYTGQGFKKYSVRMNSEIGNSWLKVGNNLSFSVTDRKLIGSSGDGGGPGNELSGIRYALIAAPVFPIYRSDGTFHPTSSELGDPGLYGDGNANPLAFNAATNWNIKRYRVFGNVFAELTPLKNLHFRTNLGADFIFTNEKLFKERLSAAIYSPTSLNESRVFEQNLVWNNSVDYRLQAGKHKVSFLAGMEAIVNRVNYLGASANNFTRTDPLFRNINNSVAQTLTNVGASGITSEWSLYSFFGQLNYSYGGRYVLNASIRRDGSSRFGQGNRFGNFPSVSAAWNVSNEAFFANIKAISALKIRASYGQLGNQDIGNYPYSSLVQTGQKVYSFGGDVATGARLVETGNSKIKWETTTQYNLGIDLSLLKDRITISADVYQKTTSDIIVRVPVPEAGGGSNPPYINAGKVQNKGLDLNLNYRNRFKKGSYGITGNLSLVRNKVISLADSEPILGGFGLSDGPITKTEPGYPIGSFFLYKKLGIFQTQEEIARSPFQTTDTRPGDVKFADLNNDGVINDKDRAHQGSPFPKFIYGLNVNLQYKNFDLSIFAQGVQGNQIYFLYGNFAYETQSRGFNSYSAILDRWTPTNPSNNIPKVSLDDRNGNRRISTRFLEDGSYLRIKNLTIGYDLMKGLKLKGVSAARLYLTIQNALTFTHYKGLDPEIQANTNDTKGYNVSSDLAVGIDWGTVPAPRTYTLGIHLDF